MNKRARKTTDNAASEVKTRQAKRAKNEKLELERQSLISTTEDDNINEAESNEEKINEEKKNDEEKSNSDNSDVSNDDSDSDKDNKNSKENKFPPGFNLSRTYVNTNCVCTLPVCDAKLLVPPIIKGEYITCVKLIKHRSPYDFLMFLMHTLKACKNANEHGLGFWNNRNIIMGYINDLYALVRINDGRDYLTDLSVQSCELLSFCVIKEEIDTAEIVLLQSFVEDKGYARRLIEEVEKLCGKELYVPEKEMEELYTFWAKVLPCWCNLYDHCKRNEEINNLAVSSSSNKFLLSGEDDSNFDEKDENCEYNFPSVGKREYFNSWGIVEERNYKETKLFKWNPAINDYDDLFPYTIIDFLPKVVVDIILRYDNSIESAMERIQNFFLAKFKCRLLPFGFTWPSKNAKDKINDFEINNIDRLLHEMPHIFWPAPNWIGSYSLKHRVEEERRKNKKEKLLSVCPEYLKSKGSVYDYCSNGEVILAALLLGYTIDEPKVNNPNVVIRLDILPSDGMIKIVKKVYDDLN